MAITLSGTYPAGRIDSTDLVGYPGSTFKNETAPGADDGTPNDREWAKDWNGFFQDLLDRASIAASGTPDKVGTSDYSDAMDALYQQLIAGGVVGNIATIGSGGQVVDSGTSLSDILSDLSPQGAWNANTNTPTLPGSATTGDFWIVSVAGATDLDGITDWGVNDWAVKTATGWAKIDNSEALTADEVAGIQASPTPITGANPAISQADLDAAVGGAYAGIEVEGAAVTLAEFGAQFLGFDTDMPNNDAVPDHTNDHITITTTGDYRVSVDWDITRNAVSKTLTWEVKKNNGATLLSQQRATSEDEQGSFSSIVTLTATDTIELWYTSGDANDIDAVNIHFSVEKL